VPGERLVIQFEDRTELQISLKAEDQIGPEAAMLSHAKQRISVWRFGDEIQKSIGPKGLNEPFQIYGRL
jgi:hypothetical protein